MTGGNAGILCNSAELTLGSNINVSGNAFGGIEVSKGKNEQLRDSNLIVKKKIINTTEAYGKPTVWIDGSNATVDDSTGMFSSDSVKEGQIQYYLNNENLTNITE